MDCALIQRHLDMDDRLKMLLSPNKTLMDDIQLKSVDYDHLEVRCFVSYDCDDDDDLDDLFQAVIDVCCVELANSDDSFHIVIQLFMPGEVTETRIYSMADMAYLSFDYTASQVEVTILRRTNEKVNYKYDASTHKHTPQTLF